MKLNRYLLICACLFFSTSFAVSEREVIKRIDSINSLALSHYLNDDIVIAFNFYKESSRLSDSIRDAYGSAVAKYNLGKIFTNMQDYKDAEQSYLEMLKNAESIDDNYLIANSYLSLGRMYLDKKALEDVIPYYKKALKFALEEDVRDPNNNDKRNHVLFDIRLSLAQAYIKSNRLDEAFIYILRAQNNIAKIDSPNYYLRGTLSYTYGLYLFEKQSFNLANNKLIEASRYLKKCDRKAISVKCNLLLSEVYKKLSLSYASLNLKDEAYSALISHNEAREQFFNEVRIKQAQIAETKLSLANYKLEAESAIKEKIAQQQVAKRVMMLNMSFIFVIIFLGVSSIVIFKNYKAKQKLNNILKVRNKQLEISRDQAQKSSELKTKFISNVTHELRTPLYGVVGLTSILLNNNNLSAKDKKYLKSLKYSGDYLLNLVNDILQIGKMESEKIELKHVSVNLRSLVDNIVNSFQNRLEETNNQMQVSIDDSIPEFIKCDNVRLSQILINLIGNSVKFTENGKICLRVLKLNGTDDNVSLRFEVEDNGPGISKEKHEDIFKNFSQLHENTNINYQGTGLGLAIVKNLVELFNGKIELESEVGKGSIFSFNVDFSIDKDAIKEAKEQNQNEKENTIQLKSGYRILIAEDNKINQIVTRNLLVKENFDCEIANNGQEAIELMQNGHFDLILMDINMPIMNGNDATEKIRSFNPTIPIIALTAADIEEVKNDYASIGYSGVITKPFDNYEFFQMINSKLEDSQLYQVS
ncbi:MAG: response regulator [Bacteroidia bacterium]|nr:response regulator [Bacteroidia bacterium]